MRKVFEHPAFHEVGLYESILQSHGIATFIRNQNVSSLGGEVPSISAYPELCVVNDEDYDRAIALIMDYRRSLPTGLTPDWTCTTCREVVPGTFTSCWNCNSAQPLVPESTEPRRSGGLADFPPRSVVEKPEPATPAPLTVTCMVIAGVIFVWKSLDPEVAMKFLCPASNEIYGGRWDGLLGSVFLHGDFMHLAFNLYWLWTFGSVLESRLKRGFWLMLFLGCAGFSSAAQLAFDGELGIGLSGVVYGFFGFLWFTRARDPAFAAVLTKNVTILMLGWLLLCFALTYANVYMVANAAHVAGLAAGSMIGWLTIRSRRTALSACGALLVFALASVAYAPWSPTFLAVRAWDLLQKGRTEQASVFLDRLARAEGTLSSWAANNLAFIRQNKGDNSGAEKIFEAALPKSEKDASFLNGYAWLLATAPDDNVRDGQKALRLALAAAELTKWKDAAVLDTLAAAYAETGDFKSAVKWQTAVSGMDLKTFKSRERLALYGQGKAYREAVRPPSGR